MTSVAAQLHPRAAASVELVAGDLFAVGVPCGSFATPGAPDPGMNIRIGGRFPTVSQRAFAMWWQLLTPLSGEAVLALSRERGEHDAPQTLRELVTAGVLVSWHGDPEVDRPLAEQLRLLPIGLGMGSAIGTPDQCSITYGFSAGTITIGRVAYTAWAASDGRQSLWEACCRAATALRTEPREVWAAFHAAIPQLTSAGMALLDNA